MHKSASFAAYDSVITAVLRKFAQLDSECAVVVDAVLGPSTQPAVPSRKRLSTLHERQQAILSQFAAQQQAFAQKFSVEEDSEPSTEQSSVCVLCRENVDDTSLPLNPSGIVALCHQSGLLSQVGNIQKSFYHFEGVKLPDLLSGSLQFSVQLNQEEIREDSDTSSQGDNDSSLETPREAREDIRGLSEGERQLCSKANHGEVDMTVPPFAICAKELMRDIDTSVGTYISSCSHVMHLKCLNTYQASLLKRHLAGEDLHVDLNYGEFFCPACRKLANCVIPILATSEMPSGSSTTIPVDPTEAVRSGLVSLSHRVYQTQICCVTLPTFETCTFLSSALATTIGVLEVKLRSETDCNSTTPALFSCLPSQQTEQISHLFRAACANYRTDSRLEDLKHVLLTSLYNRTQLSNAPGSVFTADPFSIFVHLVCMGHRPVQEILCLAFAAEMAKILLVVQPLLSSTSGTYQISETEDVPSFPIFCDFVKQYSLKTGNWSGLKTGTTLEQAVPLYCLKFLRRAALFLHLTLNYPPSPDSSFSSLLRFLHLDSALCVAQTSSSQSTTTSAAEATPPAVLTPEILSSWFSKLFSSRVPTTVTCIPTVPLTLHPLPNSFSQLFCEVTTSTCTACGAKPPKEPALCLMCGKLMCLGGKSKPSGTGPGAAAGSRGECSEHSLTCSKGTGVFLLAKQAVIVLLLPSRKDGCMWGSVYLDVHREEDPGVKRGKPLFLDQGRCAQLSSLLLSHGVEDLCAQQRTVYLPNNWNAM
ncbi:zinc finger in N-recognin protein [Pelomyxa schiedti]|nr:zinc finger in N-recognin protein [Pelomyxa schiedti]